MGQGKTELSKYINDLASKEDQTQELMRQVEHHRKMHVEAKNEIDKTEKQKNKTIELYEKKAHDNWVKFSFELINVKNKKVLKSFLFFMEKSLVSLPKFKRKSKY